MEQYSSSILVKKTKNVVFYPVLSNSVTLQRNSVTIFFSRLCLGLQNFFQKPLIFAFKCVQLTFPALKSLFTPKKQPMDSKKAHS